MKKQGNRGLIWSFVVIFLVLLLDQILKIWVKTNMTLGTEGEIHVLGNWFRLHFVENDGIAFGIKINPTLLRIFRIIATGALFWVLFRLSKKGTKIGVMIGIALITAGAMGNIIDNVFYGHIFSESTTQTVATLFPDGGGSAGWFNGKVVDMFYFPIIDTTLPDWVPFFGGRPFVFFSAIFNLADAAITIGVFYMLLFQWKWMKSL